MEIETQKPVPGGCARGREEGRASLALRRVLGLLPTAISTSSPQAGLAPAGRCCALSIVPAPARAFPGRTAARAAFLPFAPDSWETLLQPPWSTAHGSFDHLLALTIRQEPRDLLGSLP